MDLPKIAPDGGAEPGPGYDELVGIKEDWLMMSLAFHPQFCKKNNFKIVI